MDQPNKNPIPGLSLRFINFARVNRKELRDTHELDNNVFIIRDTLKKCSFHYFRGASQEKDQCNVVVVNECGTRCDTRLIDGGL